jgi:ABC-type glycerol-3-phosphate transport system substrate-binding protein
MQPTKPLRAARLMMVMGLGLSAAFAGYAQSEATPAASEPKQPPAVTPAAEQPDGSSPEQAIVIQATTESEGVKAEHAWLHSHYPGYKMTKQTLVTGKDKPYDVLHIQTADGQGKDVFFDISKFFGHF